MRTRHDSLKFVDHNFAQQHHGLPLRSEFGQSTAAVHRMAAACGNVALVPSLPFPKKYLRIWICPAAAAQREMTLQHCHAAPVREDQLLLLSEGKPASHLLPPQRRPAKPHTCDQHNDWLPKFSRQIGIHLLLLRCCSVLSAQHRNQCLRRATYNSTP